MSGDIVLRKPVEAIETVVIALEEAKSLILKGKPAHLRIALIVLDNTVETLLWRSVKIALHEDLVQYVANRMRANLAEGLAVEVAINRPNAKVPRPKLPSKRELYWMHRDFNVKAQFLTKRGLIPAETVDLLRHLHEYRNEVQHRDSLRVASIRPVSVVFFEIACDLLARLDLPGCCPSWGDQEWARKYEIDPLKRVEGDADKIVCVLRNGLSLELAEAAIRLSEDLDFRVGYLIDHLPSKGSADESLKALQFWAADKTRSISDRGPSFTSFRPPYTMRAVDRWREAARTLLSSANSLSLLRTFARIDAELGQIEEAIDELYGSDKYSGGDDMRFRIDDLDDFNDNPEREVTEDPSLY
jgi:hypothetical protein